MTSEQIMEACVLLMGARSSPAVANMCLLYHACQIKELFHIRVFVAMMVCFYVDDYLDSVKNEDEGKMMKEQLTEALKMGGFSLLKWKSNCPDLNDPPTLLPQVKDALSEEHRSEDDGVNPTAFESEERQKNGDDEDEIKSENSGLDETSLDKSKQGKTDNELLREQLQEAFESECALDDLSEMLSNTTAEKVLGVGYSFEDDCMFVKIGKKLDREVNTKRQVLSWVHSMYDPLGFICPFILKGRIFFQMINKTKIEWRQRVPPEILKPFEKWKKGVVHLKNLKIPRWTSALGMEDSIAELIMFCDASAIGYGMVAYVRRKVIDGDRVHVAFLTAKSHVVPIQMMKEPIQGQQCHSDSIPRLELCAAKLAAIWRDILVRESGKNFSEIIMFSDSLTTLGWIGNWSHKFKTYKNFRPKKIRMLTQVSE